MRIASSQITFESAHAQATQQQERIELRVRQPAMGAAALADTVTLSERAIAASAAPELEAGDGATPETSLIQLLVERLTGHKLHVVNPRALERRSEAADTALAAREFAAGPLPRQGVELLHERTRVESESLAVSAEGVVRTADGREIRFELSLALARRSVEHEQLALQLAEATPAPRKKDPLVINFDGTAAQLSGERIAFDLDADGSTEDIPFVAAGSGVLVLDRDGDGRIGDGRELFGARTGDGFAELAALDADGNGWIDEADPSYARLQVWTRRDGTDHLATLAEAGVGAIHLGQVASAFAYRDGDNQPVADLRATGIYLTEDGRAGTVQQLDLYA